MTSYDVVRRVKKQLQIKKIGHAGTLDPDATGILLLGLGFAPRFFHYLNFRKGYKTVARFGYSTDTEDASGRVCEIAKQHQIKAINTHVLSSCANSFCGSILQVPSRVSAKKVKGVRAYKMAREGVEFTLAAKPIHIDKLTPLGSAHSLQYINTPKGLALCIDCTFYVECSSGTYIRALVRDMGKHLNTPAHMLDLCRERLIFNGREIMLNDCHDLESDLTGSVIPIDNFVKRFFESITVDSDCARMLLCGQKLPVDRLGEDKHAILRQAQPIAVFDTKNRFISLLSIRDGYTDIKINNPNKLQFAEYIKEK